MGESISTSGGHQTGSADARTGGSRRLVSLFTLQVVTKQGVQMPGQGVQDDG